MEPSTQQAIELSVSQRFEIERFNRTIDATADPEALRTIAKQLLQAWHSQKAATTWVMGQQMGGRPAV
ncbi:hypothetical protein [Synechococcus sp. CCY 9618]|uniref:hypothetical protein n=1 Tax=Synechococcus sp. CCY 9618 TaxID=2815602 RepID=UPI001C217853|nr:hypothetical protein [Synechococcus sp. CCY 9618]